MSGERHSAAARDAHRRSLIKAVSWRITGSIDTFLLSWIITGDHIVAGTISGVEVLTKIALYYLHERAWLRIRWGRGGQDSGL